MIKRLISLMLAVLMLAFALVSCGGDDDALENTIENASRYTSTINLWVITESKLVQKASELLFSGSDPDKYPEEPKDQNEEQKAFLATLEEGLEETWRQVDDICDQLNTLTKKRFKTQVNIRYVTADEYYTKVEAAFVAHRAALDEAKKNGTTLIPEVTEDETVKNEHGIPELKYPAALDFQVDVLFLGGANNYFKYADNGWIAPVDQLIPNSAVQLTYHLTPALLEASKYNGESYAVPNNNALGEYTYLAVDSALMEEYYISADKMGNSLYSDETKQFLDYVYNRTTGDKIYPIYSENGKLDLEMLHYWSYDVDSVPGAYVQDPATFSLFGGFYTATTAPADSLMCRNLLTMPQGEYLKAMEKKVYYENTADYITQDKTAKSAVRVVKGGYATKAELESMGYTVLTTMAPRIQDEDVFSSMFAVGAYTQDKGRALEIIAMLNTESEVRNLFQYGIEGVNYTLKTVEGTNHVYADMKSDNMYVMDITKTGNMFVAYPNAAESDVANGKYGVDEWENAKKQNLEATLYPTIALKFSPNYVVDDKSVRVLNAVSAKFKTVVLDALTTVEDVQALKTNALAADAGAEAMATWLLSQTGEVTYLPAGATEAVAVTVADLKAAIEGMTSNYNDTVAFGSTISTKLLYEEWWFRNYAPKQ